MCKYMITHSLLSSWLYMFKSNPYDTDDDNKYNEFLLVLNREPIPVTDAMQKGNDFEILVTDIINGKDVTNHEWYEAALRVANIINGGVLQYKVQKDITANGLQLVLIGRLDALKAGTIYDTKYSGNYDAGKYINSTQHPSYFELVPEAKQFTYLVSNGYQLWAETYRRDETPSIVPTIEDFLNWLNMQGLMDIYKNKWIIS